MTIVTRRVQQRGDLRRRRIGGGDVAAQRDWRIGARRIRELQQGEHRDERAENPFKFPFHFDNRTRQQWKKFPREANLNCAAWAETGGCLINDQFYFRQSSGRLLIEAAPLP
jgi:hypothetical protein